jgi:hypothetical protein
LRTPAVTGRHFCYYHCRAHHPGARISTCRYRAPIPESVASLQIALAHTLQALGTGDISPRQSNSMMYGINLGTNLLRLAKPLSETEKQQVATDIPESMEQVLVEPDEVENDQPNQSASGPAPPSQALPVVEREIRKLKSRCLTPEQLHSYEEEIRTLKGTSNPRYYSAVDLVSHHDYATKRLREMGVL